MSDSISLQKKELREILKEKRRTVSEEYLEEAGRKITKTILQIASEDYEAILSYQSLTGEIPTGFLHEALSDGANLGSIPLYLPRTEEDIVYYSYHYGEALVKGKYGILEPNPNIAERLIFDCNKKYLILVPGLGFDGKGGRIGFGKGYYDRFLYKIKKQNIKYETAGLCLKDFIVGEIPMDFHDVYMDMVITEDIKYTFNSPRML